MDRLAERLARGEEGAFAEFYAACADRLYGYLVHQLGSREDAADVLQETFLRLTRCRSKLRGVADPVGYLFAMARNESARHVRRRLRQPRPLNLEGEPPCCNRQATDQSDRETREIVAAALASLELPLREVVELKLYAELTFAQVATVLQLPQGTVVTRYRTALGRLRVLLAREVT